jgi:predicted dehydrogenase
VRQDVDALWDLAIHDLAIFNYWLGQTPIRVQARGRVWLQPQHQISISSQVGLADLVWLTLFYPDGFEAHIHLCWLNPDKQRRLCVVGNRGTLIFDEMSKETPLVLQQGYFAQEADGGYKLRRSTAETAPHNFLPQGQNYQIIATEPAEPLFQVCDRFITDILTGKTSSLSSGWVGAQLVHILTCLTRSLEQQGEIISL